MIYETSQRFIPIIKPDPSKVPLTFTAVSSTVKVQLYKKGDPDPVTLQKSLDNGTTWTSYSPNDVISLASGTSVMFQGANDHFSKDVSNCYQFRLTGTVKASENILSLINYNKTLPVNCFYSMFSGCNTLITPPNLPATTLAQGCYGLMFRGCTKLSTAPLLPATQLAKSCYNSMFENCTSLSTAPALPATTLTDSCYQGMFQGCSKLSSAPILPATELIHQCYAQMFKNCSKLSSINVNFTSWNDNEYCTLSWVEGVAANGTFYKPKDLTTYRGYNKIPGEWKVENKD